MINITILGSGAFAKSILKTLIDNNNLRINVFGINIDEVNLLNRRFQRTNKNFYATLDLQESLINANVVIICTPARVITKLLQVVAKYIMKPTIFISTSKGFVDNRYFFSTTAVEKFIEPSLVLSNNFLSGPSFSKDMLKGKYAALNLSSTNNTNIKQIMEIFENSNLFITKIENVIAHQLFAIFKNIISLLQGTLDGYRIGKNALAFTLTQSFSLIIKIIKEFLGDKGKDIDLSYILKPAILGDLILTATSKESRNYKYGFLFAQKKTRGKIRESFKKRLMTVEGLDSLIKIKGLLKTKGINNDLINILLDLYTNNKDINFSERIDILYKYITNNESN